MNSLRYLFRLTPTSAIWCNILSPSIKVVGDKKSTATFCRLRRQCGRDLKHPCSDKKRKLRIAKKRRHYPAVPLREMAQFVGKQLSLDTLACFDSVRYTSISPLAYSHMGRRGENHIKGRSTKVQNFVAGYTFAESPLRKYRNLTTGVAKVATAHALIRD